MGHASRSPLRPLRHPPINLHPRVSSTCYPSLRLRPIYSSKYLPVLSCTLHHNIRWPQLRHWAGYAGVLLAGDVQSHGHDVDVLHGIWRCRYGRDELVGYGREGFGARCWVRNPGIDGMGSLGLKGRKAYGREDGRRLYLEQVIHQSPTPKSPIDDT